MNAQDRQAIESVFARLADVERQGGARDAEAEAFIEQRLRSQPGAAYYLAQTVVVQQQALENAQQKMARAEAAAPGAAAPGFGRFNRTPGSAGGAAGTAPSAGTPPASGFGRSAGGGFLAGAAQTAVGVAGGLMLGSFLGGLFGGNDAQAAPADEGLTPADEGGMDDGMDDGGDWGDMGDMGDF